MQNLSQTQLANFNTIGSLIVLVFNQFGVVAEQNEVVFVIGAVWSTLSVAYNYLNRYKQGDLSLIGSRK